MVMSAPLVPSACLISMNVLNLYALLSQQSSKLSSPDLQMWPTNKVHSFKINITNPCEMYINNNFWKKQRLQQTPNCNCVGIYSHVYWILVDDVSIKDDTTMTIFVSKFSSIGGVCFSCCNLGFAKGKRTICYGELI